jgi:hypothetical protein
MRNEKHQIGREPRDGQKASVSARLIQSFSCRELSISPLKMETKTGVKINRPNASLTSQVRKAKEGLIEEGPGCHGS